MEEQGSDEEEHFRLRETLLQRGEDVILPATPEAPVPPFLFPGEPRSSSSKSNMSRKKKRVRDTKAEIGIMLSAMESYRAVENARMSALFAISGETQEEYQRDNKDRIGGTRVYVAEKGAGGRGGGGRKMREFEKLPLSSSLSSSSSASAFSTSTSELKQCNKNNKSKGKGKGRDEQDSSPLTVSENLHLPRHEHLPEAIANFLESSEDMDIARYGYEYGYGCGGDTDAADDDAASGDTVHKKNIYFSNDDGDDDEEPPSQALKYYVLLMLQKQVELRNQNIGSELGDVGSTSASTASRPLAIDFIIDDTAVTSIAIAMQEVAAMVMRGKEKEVEEAMRELDLL